MNIRTFPKALLKYHLVHSRNCDIDFWNKGMDQNPTKALSSSHFKFEKLYSWTIHRSNILGRKYSGNAMDIGKVGSKTIIFTIFGLFFSKIEVQWPKNSEKTCFWPMFAKRYNIPARFYVINIRKVDSSRVKLSKLEVWIKNLFH